MYVSGCYRVVKARILFVPADDPPRRVETEEAEVGIDSAFYESVILSILT
jgi:hypothetical protein